MPYKIEWVPAEEFLSHNGVTIYHVYKNDDIDDYRYDNWFVTDPYHGMDEAFDIRELPKNFIFPGMDKNDIEASHFHILKVAINEGVLTAEGVKELA